MIDLHCDTIMKLTDQPGHGDLKSNSWQVDLDKLKAAGSLIQDFALFVDLKDLQGQPSAYARYERMLAVYKENINIYSDLVQPILSYSDVENIKKSGKIGALLSVEEGGVFEGNLEKLKKGYDDGVRLITLTWNHPNGLAFPHGAAHEGKGLTEAGIAFVETMEALGMIIDTSHLNDRGTKQLGEILKKPFIASHSNARSLTNHTRNLTDDLIKMFGNKGGVIGLNFSNHFLGETEESKIKDIVRHGLYIRDIGGSDVVALGTDFDGIQPTTEIKDMSEMPRLYEAFVAAGLSEDEVDKIFWKNADRILKEILQ